MRGSLALLAASLSGHVIAGLLALPTYLVLCATQHP